MRMMHGFSLIEILISTLISLILLAALMQVYLTSKENFRLQTDMATMQNNARMVVYFLSRRIRMAGLAVCEKNSMPVNQKQAIQALPKSIESQMIKDTDAITIAECIPYRGKERFMSIVYYIGKAQYQNDSNEIIKGLYKKPINGRRELLVSNIVNMKVVYGVVSAGQSEAIRYVSARAIRNWQDVSIVRIDFLQRSKHKILQHNMSYQFSGKNYLAKDKHYYFAWQFYVKLRERA